MRTLYFHGAPGSRSELTLFGAEPPKGWDVVDRTRTPQITGLENRIDDWAAQADAAAKEAELRLIGFSMGGFLALKVAARMKAAQVPVHLIAPPAPFQAGDWIDRLNGAPIFKLARSSGLMLSAVAAVQSAACRIAPSLVAKQIFANSAGADQALVDSPVFMERAAENLRLGMGQGSAQFCEEILGGVQDWRADLRAVENPVSIWHGSDDNWSLPEMSEYLAENLPNVAAHHRLPGLSHYSALQAYLDQQSRN